jgi:hypothetical protein
MLHPPAASPVEGSRVPLQAGAGRGRCCTSISGRRSATGCPMAGAARRPPQIALGSPMGQQLGLPAALAARASPDRPPRGAHTELPRSAALTLLPTLSLSPKRLRQPQPPAAAAPDLATVHACCCRPHTLNRLVWPAACSCAQHQTPAGPHPQCQCRRPCSASCGYALRRRG